MADFTICEKLGTMMKITGEVGALLTTKGEKGEKGEKNPNAMTIGWCTSGVMWGKSIIVVPVRQTRYSHDLLEKHDEFTVYCPTIEFAKQIAFCGSKSGRDIDKIAKLELKTSLSQTVDSPYIAEKGYVAHCRVLMKVDFNKANMKEEVYSRWYSSGESADNFHSLYYAEVLAITEK